jgi:hypothetical protein
MISNEKVVNTKVIELIEIYNFFWMLMDAILDVG